MGSTPIGSEKIDLEYIIEVEGYERPLLLLQFTLIANLTMTHKTAGKSSRWDHITDTRRCKIGHIVNFEKHVRLTSLFAGKRPHVSYRGSLALPIVQAGLEVGLETLGEAFLAWISNLGENGHCGSSKGKKRRKRAAKKYKRAFDDAVEQAVDQAVSLVGDEAKAAIKDQLRAHTSSEKLIIKKVIPRAIPERGKTSREYLVSQLHESIVGTKPSKREIDQLASKSNISEMTTTVVGKKVAAFIDELAQLHGYFGKLDHHSQNVANLILKGGERRAPIVEPVLGESEEDYRTRQRITDLTYGTMCIITLGGGLMATDYFPNNKDLSGRISEEFERYNEVRSKVDDALREGRNLVRLLNVLGLSSEELQDRIDAIEDRTELSRDAVLPYVAFLNEVAMCGRRIQQHPVSRISRRELIKALEQIEELKLPPPIQIEIDPSLIEDFDGFLADETEKIEQNDISVSEFLNSLPSLRDLDIGKIELIKGEVGLIGSNKLLEPSLRGLAKSIEDQMSLGLNPERLTEIDSQLRQLADEISFTEI